MIEVSNTMTPEEYIRKKEQEELDKFFDSIKPVKAEEVKDFNTILSEEVSKLSDLESTLCILEELYIDALKSNNKTSNEIKEISKELKSIKSQYTKQKNKLDNIIREMK